MAGCRFISESSYVRKTADDPTGFSRFWRIGRFSYFDKPEGEGCAEKFAAINYQTFWGTTPWVTLYYLGFKKLRTPVGFLFNYGKAVWPFHAVASVFAVTSCGLCSYRGKDDAWNWGIAASLAGTIPGIALRKYVGVTKNPYGNGSWFFLVPIVSLYAGFMAAGLKSVNPRILTDGFEYFDEKNQFNPEKFSYNFEQNTMPGERWTIDPVFKGFGNDMPISWIGEKWEHRKLLIKRDYGYLEGELDQVPGIERAIRERF